MGCFGSKEPVKKPVADAPKAGKTGKFKVVVLGNFTVGKTSILARETTGSFPDGTPTDKEIYKKTYTAASGTAEVNFHDTAGQEQYNVVTASIYQNAHCQLITFDVTNQESFDDLTNHLRQGQEYAKQGTIPSPVRVLLANKTDLPGRVIDKATAEKFATDNGLMFAEVSAKTGDGFGVFQQIAEKLLTTDF